MEQELVILVESKTFEELTQSELLALAEWCSTKEEFDQLKKVFQGVEHLRRSTTQEPRAEAKVALDQLFNDTYGKNDHPGVWKIIYPEEKPYFLRPLIQVAAVGLITLIALPFFRTNEIRNTVQTANQKVEINETKSPKKDNRSVEPVLVAKNELPVKENNKEQSNLSAAQPAIFDEADENSVYSAGLAESSTKMLYTVDSDVSTMMAAPASASKIADESKDLISHPDGVFQERKVIQYAIPASQQGNVLDLITASF